MTVQHLRQKMHGRRESASSSSSSGLSSLHASPVASFLSAAPSDNAAAAARFSTGYLACAQEVQRCLGVLPLDVTQQSRLCEHLAGCLQKLQHHQQQAAADLSSDVLRHHQSLQQDWASAGCKMSVSSKRHASLSSASSMTSSPPASPTNRRLDAVSPRIEVTSHGLLPFPVSSGTSLLSPASSGSTSVSSVGLLPNSVPVHLRKVIQWPADSAVIGNTNNADNKSGIISQSTHIACNPLYVSQPLKIESHQNGVALTLLPHSDSASISVPSDQSHSNSSFVHPKKRIRYSCSPITTSDSTLKLSPSSSRSSSSSDLDIPSLTLSRHPTAAAAEAWRPW